MKSNVRHMEVKFLWLQDAVKSKRIEATRVAGVESPSDVLTKPKSYREVASLLQKVGAKIGDQKLADEDNFFRHLRLALCAAETNGPRATLTSP